MMDSVVEERSIPDETRPLSLRGRVRRWLFPESDRAQRLQALDDAIALYPDTPSNYVVRGELYLEVKQVDLAVLDFRRALDLASRQVETNDWGFIAQVMQDRAQHGLDRAQRMNRVSKDDVEGL
jgi:Tfp pilus assembly protein PilF